MSGKEKECQECGWRGAASELDESTDEASGQTHKFCPECGSAEIKELNPEREA
jgi:predicted RNA-binding Zn-ribbon protein involved in translation (DUF1610 family)